MQRRTPIFLLATSELGCLLAQGVQESGVRCDAAEAGYKTGLTITTTTEVECTQSNLVTEFQFTGLVCDRDPKCCPDANFTEIE